MRRYFVSFATAGPVPGTWGFGTAEVTLDNRVRSLEDVEKLADAVRATKPAGTQIAVLNWQEFS